MLFDILRKKGYGDEYVQRYQVGSACWLRLLPSEQCMPCLVHGCSTLQAAPTKPLPLLLTTLPCALCIAQMVTRFFQQKRPLIVLIAGSACSGGTTRWLSGRLAGVAPVYMPVFRPSRASPWDLGKRGLRLQLSFPTCTRRQVHTGATAGVPA